MSDILLINSPNRTSEPPRHYPYGIGLLNAVLEEAGHQVAYFDGNFSTLEDLERHLDDRCYTFIGISGLVTTYAFQRAAARISRVQCAGSIIATGGGLASAVGGELLELIPELDLVFIGEAEESLPEFLTTFRPVPGIAYRDGGSIKTMPPAPLIHDLDGLPLPSLDQLDLERYFQGGSFPLTPQVSSARKRGNVLSCRGCPFGCDFCFNGLGRQRVRYRSVENVLTEIDDLSSRYSIDFVSFLDESFLANRARALEIAAGIRVRFPHLRWGAAARSTSIDADFLSTIKEAGCDYLYYGFDSGSPQTLLRMSKRVTVQDNIRAFRASIEAGIHPVPNIIIGYDNESLDDIQENYRFFAELIRWGSSLTDSTLRARFERGFRNFGAIYLATPYPGTRLFERNRHHLPHLAELLERLSGKDAYELTVNVSRVPDRHLVEEQKRMESFVRSFAL